VHPGKAVESPLPTCLSDERDGTMLLTRSISHYDGRGRLRERSIRWNSALLASVLQRIGSVGYRALNLTKQFGANASQSACIRRILRFTERRFRRQHVGSRMTMPGVASAAGRREGTVRGTGVGSRMTMPGVASAAGRREGTVRGTGVGSQTRESNRRMRRVGILCARRCRVAAKGLGLDNVA
jgi:hypothetical protein